MRKSRPHFTIVNHFQKRKILYSDLLTDDILTDVCYKITGEKEYTCDFVEQGYNKGRMAVLEYQNETTYISFSETKIDGRNSYFQSVITALNIYHLARKKNKKICYYFLPSKGNNKTKYFLFMYRVMMTAGIEFVNIRDYMTEEILPFNSVEDLIVARNINKGKNKSNNSTFITLSEENTPQIYGKTYGASKYETTLFAVALTNITNKKIELYEIREKDLKELPKASLDVMKLLKIKIIPTSMTMERNYYDKEDSLRTPRYIYNLLLKLGQKRCSLCECEMPQLIQGAHIWPVADIKKQRTISLEDRLEHAVDPDNGLWLCQNHHKLFDEDIIKINVDGSVEYTSKIKDNDVKYLNYITTKQCIDNDILTPKFIMYLTKRYNSGIIYDTTYNDDYMLVAEDETIYDKE